MLKKGIARLTLTQVVGGGSEEIISDLAIRQELSVAAGKAKM